MTAPLFNNNNTVNIVLCFSRNEYLRPVVMGNSTSSTTSTASTKDAVPLSHHQYYTDEDYDDPFDGIDTLGYRVLGVQPDSPAAAADLVSFLDFLVGANNKMLLGSGEDLEPGQEYDDVDFPALLEANKGKAIELCKFL
jgi:hypothetical protein